jgi:hypothetical protein
MNSEASVAPSAVASISASSTRVGRGAAKSPAAGSADIVVAASSRTNGWPFEGSRGYFKAPGGVSPPAPDGESSIPKAMQRILPVWATRRNMAVGQPARPMPPIRDGGKHR